MIRDFRNTGYLVNSTIALMPPCDGESDVSATTPGQTSRHQPRQPILYQWRAMLSPSAPRLSAIDDA
jgi:hypothetical protein